VHRQIADELKSWRAGRVTGTLTKQYLAAL
jgi:hypothetical protein